MVWFYVTTGKQKLIILLPTQYMCVALDSLTADFCTVDLLMRLHVTAAA